MYSIKNKNLEIMILDPVKDRERMGTRYCTGGYIFQVVDKVHGDLMSGPTYPDSFNIFDGQGIPDAFNLRPLQKPTSKDDRSLIPGIGLCNLAQNSVETWCDWQVETGIDSVRMLTRQSFEGYEIELERIVSLTDRTIRSYSHMKNLGKGMVPIFWFPHPFYPHPQTDELIKLGIHVTFPDNPGFEMGSNGFIRRKGWPWEDGHYQILDHQANTGFSLLQKHPILGMVAATCSFTPTFFPIWGNTRTFSWEPFYEKTLGADQETSWWIDYEF